MSCIKQCSASAICSTSLSKATTSGHAVQGMTDALKAKPVLQRKIEAMNLLKIKFLNLCYTPSFSVFFQFQIFFTCFVPKVHSSHFFLQSIRYKIALIWYFSQCLMRVYAPSFLLKSSSSLWVLLFYFATFDSLQICKFLFWFFVGVPFCIFVILS